MEVHANAPLSPRGRQRVVDRVLAERWSVTAAAEAAAVSERTVYRWLARYRADGPEGLLDRRPVPRRIPHKTSAQRVAAICALRQHRLTAAEIAEQLKMPLSTVSAWLPISAPTPAPISPNIAAPTAYSAPSESNAPPSAPSAAITAAPRSRPVSPPITVPRVVSRRSMPSSRRRMSS